jgi:hypothetical protein
MWLRIKAQMPLNMAILMLLVGHSMICRSQSKPIEDQPIELGKVNWSTNYNKSLEMAKISNKSVLILFQEVPGCSTCQNYGRNVLSHPLIVDAIENAFVPLLVYNNKKGQDAQILAKYNEPSWNNPVVRIVNPNGKDVVPRLNGNYTAGGLINNMIQALEIQKKNIPEYLNIMSQELSVKDSDKEDGFFSMYCFWSGEAHLGQAKGILETTPGFMNGKEVVHVSFDKKQTNLKDLAKHGQKADINLESKIADFKPDKDPQYYLKHSDYKYLALTKLQKTKINSALKQNTNPSKYLSPTQALFFEKIKTKMLDNLQILYDHDFNSAWLKMTSR